MRRVLRNQKNQTKPTKNKKKPKKPKKNQTKTKKNQNKPKKTKKPKTVVAELVAEGVAELVAEGVAEPLPIPYMHPRGGRGEGASWKVAGKRWVPPRFEASPSNYHTLGSPRPSIYIKALFFLVETRHTSQMILAASNIAKLAFNRITFL